MKKERELNSITDELSKNLIRDGIIKTKGKTNEQIRLEIKDYLLKNINALSDFELTLDFMNGILNNAQYFLDKSDFHSAIIFYALWLEHWFNQIILTSLKRKNISIKFYKDIIRSTNINAKQTWLWQLLQLKPINKSHLKIIEKVFEERNAFIHYKWRGYKNIEIEPLIVELKELKKFVSMIDKTIIYLKNFENRNVYYNKKKVIKNIIELSN